MARGRSDVLGAAVAAALVYFSGTVLAAFIPGLRHAVSAPRGLVARHAEGERAEKGDEEGEGFMKFLKVEQDIELSPEEYAMALEQEVESQRKRYYIGGKVKENNLIVPWKPVDERQLIKDARRQLKRNGIVDPSGDDEEADNDSEMDMTLIGGEDVKIEWTMGQPGTKVGYIVEKKRAKDTNFREIGSYDATEQSFLLAKPYAGHEYIFSDDMAGAGQWTYRILCRYRSGEIVVVDQKDITVPEVGGIPFVTSLVVFLVVIVAVLVGSYFADQPVKY